MIEKMERAFADAIEGGREHDALRALIRIAQRLRAIHDKWRSLGISSIGAHSLRLFEECLLAELKSLDVSCGKK